MGQSEVIEFLQKEYYRNRKRKFKREEIEEATGKIVDVHSLSTLVYYGEIEREVEFSKFKTKIYSYRYKPHGSFKIIVFKK